MPGGADAEQHASQSEAPIKPNRLVIHTTGNMTHSTSSLNINALLTLGQGNQVFGTGAFHRIERNSPIKRNEATAVMHRKRQQVNIRDLSMPQHPGPIEYSLAEHIDIRRPEFMVGTVRSFRQPVCDLRCCQTAWIFRLRHDAYATVL